MNAVLIAGAGPVGLVAALSLARRAVPVEVFEAEAELPTDLRASTWHPPTLDLMEELGIAGQLIDNGLVAPTWQYRDRKDGPVAVFDMALLKNDTHHPYRVQCEQWKATRYLKAALEQHPHVRILFGHRARDLRQTADGVTLICDTPDGEARHDGRFLIAADGARSAIRKALGVEFEGFTYPERFQVVSTPFEFADHLPQLSYINYISDPEEWFVLLRTRDLWRVLLPTSAEGDGADLLSDAALEQRLQSIVATPRRYEKRHRTLYAVHQRVAAKYRVGNAFLAGDSAHINNPLGGMGMNGGIHDALNLADKLVDVLQGGDPAQLDRYERQRRPVAIEDVHRVTARNQELMNQRDPEVRRRSLDQLRRTAADPKLAYEMLLRSSMIASLRKAAATP